MLKGACVSVIAVVLVCIYSKPSKSDINSCMAILDSDTRRFCMARATKSDNQGVSRNECAMIRDQDIRNYCVGVITGELINCLAIRGNDIKSQCLGEVKQ